jgi:hypothetical protein
MNREQRRQQVKKQNMAAGQMKPGGQTSIDYGHNGQAVVMLFNVKIENLLLSEQQVDGMIEGLKTAKAALMAHKAAAAQQGGPGHA